MHFIFPSQSDQIPYSEVLKSIARFRKHTTVGASLLLSILKQQSKKPTVARRDSGDFLRVGSADVGPVVPDSTSGQQFSDSSKGSEEEEEEKSSCGSGGGGNTSIGYDEFFGTFSDNPLRKQGKGDKNSRGGGSCSASRRGRRPEVGIQSNKKSRRR